MKITITENINERLDLYLVKTLTDKTRSQIKLLIENGEILVNNNIVKSGHILKTDDIIAIDMTEPKEMDLKPVDLKLEIVYEDTDLLVVNKPKGLVVHPSSTYSEATLVHGLLHQVNNLSGINGVLRPGIIHRIDKDTSGLLLVAKSDIAHKELSKDLKEHTIKREYRALVYGEFDETSGVIEAKINRNPKSRLKMAITDDGRDAITTFKVLERFNGFTYISCTLKTGRTHQIRVHMSYIGHPVVGDSLYGPRKVIGKTGQFLHAYLIGFMHPTKKKYLEFVSQLPLEFEHKLDEFRQLT